MEYKNFILTTENKIAILKINRPELRNALNSECWLELGHFLDDANTNDDIAVVILTGAGDKAFIAGADLKSLQTKTAVDVLYGTGQNVVKKIEECSKPVIAAINGLAFGGGCEITLACDIRIVADNAMFGLPEAALGILPGTGGTQRLSKLIGLGRAKEVIMAGRVLTAQEAVQFGLAYKCVAQADLMKEALAVAETMMQKGPMALRLCKKLVNASLSTDQEAGMLLELYGLSLLMNSEDKAEGINAFFEKRKPAYKGR